LSYQHQTWYTYSRWQDWACVDPEVKTSKVKVNAVITRAAEGMQVDMTAWFLVNITSYQQKRQ